MSKIQINDLFDELREENNRLLTELIFSQKCIELLEKYRNCLTSFNNNCKCITNCNNRIIFDALENVYKNIFNNQNELINGNKLVVSKTVNTEDRNQLNNGLNSFNCHNNLEINHMKNCEKTLNIDNKKCNKLKTILNAVNKRKTTFATTKIANESIKSFKEKININNSNIAVNDKTSNEENNESNYGMTGDSIEQSSFNPNEQYGKIWASLDRQKVLNDIRLNKVAVINDYENDMISVLRPKINVRSDDCFETGNIIGFRCNWTECQFMSRKRTAVISHFMTKHTNIRPFSCDTCGKKYATNDSLNSHKLNIHDESSGERLKCDWPQCQFKTHKIYLLETHQMRHKKIKPFKCDFSGCDASFTTNSELSKHKNTVHSNLRPFLCEWPGCEFAAKTKHNLEAHKAIHSGEKPFGCDYPNCGMSFSSKRYLTDHKMSHKSVKKHVCHWPGCEKSFSKRNGLETHINGHKGVNPFKCERIDCSKSFTSKECFAKHLKYHKRKDLNLAHTPIRKYLCDWPECNESFVQKHQLSAHLNRHRGLKPFRCEFGDCGKNFALKRYLFEHLKTHEKKFGQKRHENPANKQTLN